MNERFLIRTTAVGLVAAALTLTGCESTNMSERQKGTAVVGGVVGGVVGNIWSKRQEERRIAMEQSTRGIGVEVSRTADNQLKVNVPSDISFDTNSAAIRPQLRSVLDPFAASVKDDPNTRLTIVGHTDSTGSDRVNNPLSVERAQSVRDYLSARGVSPQRVEVAGRGEREPIADNNTEAGRAKNRRVEIYLREPGA